MCVINGFFVVWPVRYVCCVFGGSFIPPPAPPPFAPAPRKSESSHLVPSSIKQSRQWCAATGDNTHTGKKIWHKNVGLGGARTHHRTNDTINRTRAVYTHTHTRTRMRKNTAILLRIPKKKATTTHTFTSTAVARDFFAAPPC